MAAEMQTKHLATSQIFFVFVSLFFYEFDNVHFLLSSVSFLLF